MVGEPTGSVDAVQDDVVVRDAPAHRRFEVVVGGEVAGYAQYRLVGENLAVLHTVIDDAYEGRGLGSRLVREVLQQVSDRGLGLLPYCPFVKAYLQRHRDLVSLVPAERRAEFDLERPA